MEFALNANSHASSAQVRLKTVIHATAKQLCLTNFTRRGVTLTVPPGTGPDADTLTCFPCLPGCDLCDIQNKTKCLKCTAPTVVYQNECVSECPEGWVVEENGIACREWWIGDWPLVWFPFLITGLIFTIICLFGLMKKQAYLSHGKMALRAPQNTLTCIIIALAPL